MSYQRQVFDKIEYNYWMFPYSTREGRLIRLFYLSHGVKGAEICKAIQSLVRVGLVKCIERNGPAHWDVAYREGTSAELIPTEFAFRLMKAGKLRKFFMTKGLY